MWLIRGPHLRLCGGAHGSGGRPVVLVFTLVSGVPAQDELARARARRAGGRATSLGPPREHPPAVQIYAPRPAPRTA